MKPVLPTYPVYVPSKGRFESGLTAKCLIDDGVPFNLVVEPNERDEYAKRFPEANLLVLPWNDLGVTGLIAARNWIKDHATKTGAKRHWQLDDNIRRFMRWHRGKRLRCGAGVALRACEDFVDRYTNVAIAGLNYDTFARGKMPPFNRNVHVYSCTLVLNEIPNAWRLPYNDDTDMCLQVLADGWCTILMNAFLADKRQTMHYAGGNTPIYQNDGRLRMARQLERMWPGVVVTKRKFKRPQHHITANWRKFDNELIRRDDIDFDNLPANDYGLKLEAVGEVKSERLKKMLD